jgi:hypothetical protein
MRVFEFIDAFGHEKIKATHRTTLEITKEKHLTGRGDCIVAVGASKGAADLSSEFKQLSRSDEAKITIVLEVEGFRESALGYGSRSLSLRHPTDLVARKSSYICDRTLMIHSNKAACDFPRPFVDCLRNQRRKVEITLLAEI